MALVNIFYIDDEKGKNVDVFKVDASVAKRIAEDMTQGKPCIVFSPGECGLPSKSGLSIITYAQYINTKNIAKIIIDDLSL